MLTYREIAPSPALARHVECFWTLRSASSIGAPRTSRVLPDGCIDILFDFGGSPYGAGSGRVIGAMRTAREVALSGAADLLGVRFLPGAAPSFLSAPADEMTDGVLPLSDLWCKDRGQLESILAELPPEQRVDALERALTRRMRSQPHEPALRHATSLVRSSHGGMPVAALAAELGIGARRLERLFRAGIGLSPKVFSRIVRFRAATALLRSHPGIGWSELAYRGGYADQAHLARECRDLAGCTPTTLRRDVAFVQDAAGAEG